MRDGKLRFIENIFPNHAYNWNYGALPQTWTDPAYIDPITNAPGDNEQLDVCEIGYRVKKFFC
jgi:inorganic pyrophosphatase